MTTRASVKLHTEQHHRVIIAMLLTLVARHQALRIFAQMKHWEEHHGAEWLVSRLKNLSLDLLGQDVKGIKHHPDGSWVGPFRSLYKVSLKSRTKFSRALKFLKVHKHFKAKITRRDYFDEIRRLREPETKGVTLTASAPFKRDERPCRLVVTSTKHQMELVKLTMKFPRLAKAFYKEFSSSFDMPPFEAYMELRPYDIVGTFTLLNKDGGLKKRGVFSPHPYIQALLQPLYRDLKSYAATLPGLHHEDQETGLREAILLCSRGPVLSVDIKAASDNIPLRPQIEFLKSLFPYHERLILLFEQVARSAWKTPFYNPDNESGLLIMERGQPMGLNVSFLSFSIYLHRLVSQVISPSNFVQVGDDLLCLDVASVVDHLINCNVPISVQKTLKGPFGEFVGTVFDKDGDLAVRSSRNWIYLFSNFGKGMLKYCPASLRWTWTIACLPKPVGQGLNPQVIESIPLDLLEDLYTPKVELYLTSKFEGKPLQWYAETFVNAIDSAESVLINFPNESRSAVYAHVNSMRMIGERMSYQSGLPEPLATWANMVAAETGSNADWLLQKWGHLYGYEHGHQDDQGLTKFVVAEPERKVPDASLQLWGRVAKHFTITRRRSKMINQRKRVIRETVRGDRVTSSVKAAPVLPYRARPKNLTVKTAVKAGSRYTGHLFLA